MRVPLEWLRDYVDVDLAPADLAEELTLRGMETTVETSDVGWTDVVVGRVLEVERHPAADTLWLTRVMDEVSGCRQMAAVSIISTTVIAVMTSTTAVNATRIAVLSNSGPPGRTTAAATPAVIVVSSSAPTSVRTRATGFGGRRTARPI